MTHLVNMIFVLLLVFSFNQSPGSFHLYQVNQSYLQQENNPVKVKDHFEIVAPSQVFTPAFRANLNILYTSILQDQFISAGFFVVHQVLSDASMVNFSQEHWLYLDHHAILI